VACFIFTGANITAYMTFSTAAKCYSQVLRLPLLLYTNLCWFVNYLPEPSDRLDVIKGWHSRSVWVVISPRVSDCIDVLLKVIDTYEWCSKCLCVVVDNVLHKSQRYREWSEPLQGYYTRYLIVCQVPLYDPQRGMISNGDESSSEVIRGGWQLLGSVLRLQFSKTFRER